MSKSGHQAHDNSTEPAPESFEHPSAERPNAAAAIRRLNEFASQSLLRTRNTKAPRRSETGKDALPYDDNATYVKLKPINSFTSSKKAIACGCCGKQKPPGNGKDRSRRLKAESKMYIEKGKTNSYRASNCTATDQARSISYGSATTLALTDGFSNGHESTTTLAPKTCNHCGKKKPSPSSDPSRLSMANTLSPSPLPAGHIASQHVMYSPAPRFPTDVPRRKPVPSRIMTDYNYNHYLDNTLGVNVTPPTAGSERPPSSTLTRSNVEVSPLLQAQMTTKKSLHHSPSISSVASTIARSISGRRLKNEDMNRLSDDASHQQNGESTASGLVSFISSVVQRNSTLDYNKINNQLDPIGQYDIKSPMADSGRGALESLGDIEASNPKQDHLWEKTRLFGTVPGSPDHFHSGQAGFLQDAELGERHPERPEAALNAHATFRADARLTVSGASNELTRFKSLRNGV